MINYSIAALVIVVDLLIIKEAFWERSVKEGLNWLAGRDKKPNSSSLGRTVTVLIPAYNEESTIKQTIESVKDQTREADRILVVDDSSTDNTAEVARESGAEVITTPENAGTKSQAQDFALSHLERDSIVVTIDADTVLDCEALERIVPHFYDNKTLASVCGFVIPQKVETFWERVRLIQYLYGISLNKSAQNHWKSPLVSSGCFSAFEVGKLKDMGGFPDNTMAEDMDLTWRYLQKGYDIKLEPAAVCYPLDPPTYKVYKAQVERWYRSFFQNISLHKRNFLKNKRLGLFVSTYLVLGLLTPAVIAFAGVTLAIQGPLSEFSLIFLAFFGANFMLVNVITLIKARSLNKLSVALKSLHCYWLEAPVEVYLFLKSFYLEWIKRDRLAKWEKGH